MAKCSKCGREVKGNDCLVSLSIPGKEPTPPVCGACFRKVPSLIESRMRKERAVAKKSKPIVVELTCPHCGKALEAKVNKVIDEPATPAEFHFEAEVVKAKGSLYDVKE